MLKILCCILALGALTPLFGQQSETLIGTWERAETTEEGILLVTRVEFKADGQFALNFRSALSAEELLGEGEGEDEGEGEEPADEGAELAAQIFAELLPDTLAISVTATGTWEAEGETLHLDAMASQMTINGLDPQEFFTQIAEEMARRMAEAFEVSEADYPDFEQQIVENVLSGAGAGFSEGFAADELDLVATYALEEGVLSITEEDGETTAWARVVSSAVAPATWGQVKAFSPSVLLR